MEGANQQYVYRELAICMSWEYKQYIYDSVECEQYVHHGMKYSVSKLLLCCVSFIIIYCIFKLYFKPVFLYCHNEQKLS